MVAVMPGCESVRVPSRSKRRVRRGMGDFLEVEVAVVLVAAPDVGWCGKG